MSYIKDFEDDFIDKINNELEDEILTEEEFENKIYTFLHEDIDWKFTHYQDQIDGIKELHLYDFSHLDNPQTLGQVCVMGLEDELHNSGRIFDKDNYNIKIKS